MNVGNFQPKNEELRILEKELYDGRIKYVLEKYEDGDWTSVFAHDDLQVIRDAKKKRENPVKSVRVIE